MWNMGLLYSYTNTQQWIAIYTGQSIKHSESWGKKIVSIIRKLN